MNDYTSRYDENDEVYDPNAYIQEMIDDLRRDAEGLKLDGKYSQLGLKLLQAADALEDLYTRNEELLDKIMIIEDIATRVLR